MPPRLRFFIVRPEVTTQTPTGAVHKQLGPIVPLIPADELPDWLDVVSAPRELTVEQTVALTNLGTFAKNDDPFSVRIAYSSLDLPKQQQSSGATVSWADDVPDTPVHPADKMKAHWAEPRHGLSSSIHNRPDGGQGGGPPNPVANTNTNTAHHCPTPPSSPPSAPPSAPVPVPIPGTKTVQSSGPVRNSDHNPTTHPSHQQQQHPNQQQHSNQHQQSHQPPNQINHAQPSPTQPPQDYCRHWCHHGTCKWGHQCRYIHAMPTTPQGLADVGLREFPAWFLGSSSSSLVRGSGGPPPAVVGAVPLSDMFRHRHLDLHQQGQFFGPVAGTGGEAGGVYDARLAALRHLGLLGGVETGHGSRGPGRGGAGAGIGGGMVYHTPYAHAHAPAPAPIPAAGAVVPPLSNKKLKAQLREVVGVLNRLGITTGPTGANVNRLVQQRKRELTGEKAEEGGVVVVPGPVVSGDGKASSGDGAAAGVGASASGAPTQGQVEAVTAPLTMLDEVERLVEL